MISFLILRYQVVLRVFKTRYFQQIARKIGILDAALCKSVDEMTDGLHDGDLGRHIFKKRIGIGGRGKRSDARTILATNLGSLWFFSYAFKKNVRADISHTELVALQEPAEMLLDSTAVSNGSLEEICNDDKNQAEK